jgi:hypothetical protein
MSLNNRRYRQAKSHQLLRRRLDLELLEARIAPATYIVMTPDDNGDDKKPRDASLRGAIKVVNDGTLAPDGTKYDKIDFEIPPGKEIEIQHQALPPITRPVTIEGKYTIPRIEGTFFVAISGAELKDPTKAGLTFVVSSSPK